MKKALTIFVSLSAVSVCIAAGLSTRFSDIEVFDVPLGRRIVIPGPEGKSMRLKNLSDTPVRITFHVDQPSARELRADMEPLPDLRWVQLSANAVQMAPRGEADVRVSVRVPQDRRHRGSIINLWLGREASLQKMETSRSARVCDPGCGCISFHEKIDGHLTRGRRSLPIVGAWHRDAFCRRYVGKCSAWDAGEFKRGAQSSAGRH